MLQALEGERREWLGVLARAPRDLLEDWFAAGQRPAYQWLRRPEIGLVMLRGRIGGTGAPFNLGEATVTRCALRLATGEAGVGWVLGRDPRRAELVALADAMLQRAPQAERVRARLLEPARAQLAAERAVQARKAAATRVDFFALARTAGETV